MDIWFTLFIFATSIAAGVGMTLVLVGYIGAMPATFGYGRRWLYSVGVIPSAIVVLPVAADLVLILLGYGMPPFVLARWLAIPAIGLHLGAIAWFVATHWADSAKPGKQLGGGLLLIALAAGLLYGAGPLFAERIVASVK